jgi:hypothetical protein
MTASPIATAQILPFPRRVQPHSLDLSRATPADQAALEAVRRNTVAVIAAHRQADRAELVSALLMAMESLPLDRPLCYPSRDITGRAFVVVTVGGTVFRLQPDDCRTAADALIADPSVTGCIGDAARLREAAALAEVRPAHGGPLSPPASHPGRTGMVTTVTLVVLIVTCLILARGLSL